MEISKLITQENNIAVHQVLVIAKQDIALQNAVNALNELSHINRLQFEDFGQSYGITGELLQKIYTLKQKLQKAKYGRF